MNITINALILSEQLAIERVTSELKIEEDDLYKEDYETKSLTIKEEYFDQYTQWFDFYMEMLTNVDIRSHSINMQSNFSVKEQLKHLF